MAPKIVETLYYVWPQWVSCFMVSVLSMILGLVVGWTSPYIAKLTNNEESFNLTHLEASWVVSLLPLGRLLGAICGAVILEYRGSKTALLLTGVPVIMSWICIIFASSVGWLYVSRTFSGISFGMYFSCFSIYVGEIASANIRGALVGFISNGMPIGTMIGTWLGTEINMPQYGIFCLIVNICYIAGFFFFPSTPHYHVRRDDMEKAAMTVKWFNREPNRENELKEIQSFIRASQAVGFRQRLELLYKDRRVFAMVMLLFIFMQLGGVNNVLFYMEIITSKAQLVTIDPEHVVILSSGFGIAIGWIDVYLIDRCGRRILLVISSFFVFLAFLILALHFMLLDLHVDPIKLEWLPVLGMLLFPMISIGLSPVPTTMLGEVFPASLKSIAGFIVSITSAIFAFACSMTYLPMVDWISEKWVFTFYAMVMLAAVIFSFLYVPETKGKTLQEIQTMLHMENEYG